MASRISSKVVAAFMFVSVVACGSKTENKVKPLAGAGAAGNTAAVVDPKPGDPAANGAGANTATPTPAAAEDAMKYIAENSNMLVVIDVKKLVSSPMLANPAVKAELDKMKEDEDFKKLTAAGIDPFTNVDKIVVSGDAAKETFVIVVSGSFDAAKAAEAAKAEMAKEGDGKGAIEVAGANTLIISEKPESIATAKSGKGVDGSPSLKDAMAMVDMTRPIYVIGNIPAEAAGEMKDVPGMTSAKNAALSVAFDKGFEMAATVQLGSEADAASVKKAADEAMPMLAMLQLPPDITSAIKVETKGTNVSVSISLNEEQLKKLEEMSKQMPGMAPMPMEDGAKDAAPGAEPAKEEEEKK